MADVTVETFVDEDAVVAKVTVKLSQDTTYYTGSSKRHPKDPVDPRIGESLAIARAMHKATKDLLLYAENRMRDNAYYSSLWEAPFFKEPELNATSR